MGHYPQFAGKAEFSLQVAIGVAFLFQSMIYFMTRDIIHGPDAAERVAIMLRAVQISGVSFLMSITTTFLRRWTSDNPLIFIWFALMLTTAIAAGSAALLFLASY